ncbi:MAG: flagellar hook-basal body complex protein [Legionellaceae bacterium]|nr:flagellar hook-basal body complex protein [Legionellaceae bacterium]
MSDAMSIAASGLKTEELNLDRIANDLANLNTNNYKASKLQFEDIMVQQIQSTNALFMAGNSAKIGLGTAIYGSSKDFSPGPLKATANWNDVGINGQGFFQILREDGSSAFTRASSLTIDKERYLCTADGSRLYDGIQIPEDFVKITIQKNGDVEAILPNEQEPQLLGNIKLAKFMSPEQLNPLGSGIYSETEESGPALMDYPGQSGLGELLQGQVEASNVDMVNSLMQLTMAQRIYQINAKALQIADELEKETNEIRA